MYAQVSPRPFDITISFDQSPAFVALRSWNFLIQQTPAEKRPLLADAEWRASARADWDRVGDGFTIFPVSQTGQGEADLGATRRGAVLGASLADLVSARGGHPSDVLADWVLDHDLAPGIVAEAVANNDRRVRSPTGRRRHDGRSAPATPVPTSR